MTRRQRGAPAQKPQGGGLVRISDQHGPRLRNKILDLACDNASISELAATAHEQGLGIRLSFFRLPRDGQ